MDGAILELKNISKSYNNQKVVDNVSFALKKGQCLGLLGPNGAGKSTTIEIIEQITKPDSGQLFYKGKPIDKQFISETGIQFQNTALMDFLSVKDQLNLFSRLFANSVPLDELIAYCQLESFTNREVKKLSGGQRQRVLLAIALINDPQIIFLDEPTTGLDPQSRSRFWQIIQKLKNDGKSIILTTHYMDEAESLSDQLILLDNGKIIAKGSPTSLLNEHFQHSIISIDIQKWLPNQKLNDPFEQINNMMVIHSKSVASTVEKLIANGQTIDNLQVRKPTLEDLFLKLTGHDLRE